MFELTRVNLARCSVAMSQSNLVNQMRKAARHMALDQPHRGESTAFCIRGVKQRRAFCKKRGGIVELMRIPASGERTMICVQRPVPKV